MGEPEPLGFCPNRPDMYQLGPEASSCAMCERTCCEGSDCWAGCQSIQWTMLVLHAGWLVFVLPRFIRFIRTRERWSLSVVVYALATTFCSSWALRSFLIIVTRGAWMSPPLKHIDMFLYLLPFGLVNLMYAAVIREWASTLGRFEQPGQALFKRVAKAATIVSGLLVTCLVVASLLVDRVPTPVWIAMSIGMVVVSTVFYGLSLPVTMKRVRETISNADCENQAGATRINRLAKTTTLCAAGLVLVMIVNRVLLPRILTSNSSAECQIGVSLIRLLLFVSCCAFTWALRGNSAAKHKVTPA